MGQLLPELSFEQKARAEEVFLRRAPANTPRRLARLAPQVLAEGAPELAETPDEHATQLELQRRRAVTKRSFS